METVWIVVAIALAIVLIVLLLMIGSGRIGQFRGWASMRHGKTEFEGGAEMGESKLGRPASRTKVSGNFLDGEDQEISASGNVEAVDNVLQGKRQKINVDEFSNESRRTDEKKKHETSKSD